MKTYYADRLIDYAEPNLVHDQFGDKYPIPQHGGKTIEFRKYSPLDKALTALTEGVTPAGNKLNVSTVEATVDQYGDYIEISDVLELTATDRNLEQATKLLAAGRPYPGYRDPARSSPRAPTCSTRPRRTVRRC